MRIRKNIKTATVFHSSVGEINVVDANANVLHRLGFTNLVEHDTEDIKRVIEPVSANAKRSNGPGVAPGVDIDVSKRAKNAGNNTGEAARRVR